MLTHTSTHNHAGEEIDFHTPPESPVDDKEENIFDHISSLPYLKTGNPGPVDDESVLASATRRLKLDFTSLLTKVRLSLQKLQVTPESLLSHLKSVEAIGPHFEAVYTYRSDSFGRTLSKRLISLEELFPAIAPYCSWFNHLLVENIIETFCEDDEKILQKWEAFKQKFAKYCEGRLCKCPQDQFGEDSLQAGTTSVVMKIDCHWKTVKVKQLAIVRDTVSQFLAIKPYNLYLRAVKNGCVELLFYVPTFVAVKFIPPSAEQVLALQNACVIQLQCDPEFVDRRYSYPGADVSMTMSEFFTAKDFSNLRDVAEYLSGNALLAYETMMKAYRRLTYANIGSQLRLMGDALETRLSLHLSILRGVPFAIAHAFIFPHLLPHPYSVAAVSLYLVGVDLYVYYAIGSYAGRYLNLRFPATEQAIPRSFYLFLNAPVFFILPFQLLHLCRSKVATR